MKAEAITSARNHLVKDIRRAAARGGLTEEGLAVAEGFHLLEEAIRSGCEIQSVFTTDSSRAAVIGHVHDLDLTLYTVPGALFSEIASTESPAGVLALVRPAAWTLEDVLGRDGVVVVLDGLQEPGNAGAIVRAAEAFGAAGIIHLKGNVSLFNPKAMRASTGSLFRVPFVSQVDEPELLSALAARGIQLFAAVPAEGIDIAATDFKRHCAIIIGSEARGVSTALIRQATGVRIPTTGVESLNAAVAAGIILYEARRQRMRLN